jgi:protoporphyrinogen oxidase
VPEVEEQNGWHCLGVLYNSSSFAGRVRNEDQSCSFSLMFGGTTHPEYFAWDDNEVKEQVLNALQRLSGFQDLSSEFLEMRVHRWGQAIPIHDSDLRLARECLGRTFCAQPGRVVFGNWTGEVSLRGMIESWSAATSS